MTAREELIVAILSSTNNRQLQQALLVGSYGESGWDPYASGSGGGGAFGFTPPSYPAWLETAPPDVQVNAILPAYKIAQSQLPSSITNPAAQAEWIAIAAERPEYDTLRMSMIVLLNYPTIYGANYSYYVQNWDEIVSLTTPNEKGDDMWAFVNNIYYRLSQFTPTTGQAPNTVTEQWRTMPQSVGQAAQNGGIVMHGADALALWDIHKP